MKHFLTRRRLLAFAWTVLLTILLLAFSQSSVDFVYRGF